MTTWDAARAVQGEPSGDNAYFTGVSTDSRMAGPGDLFIALIGDKFDGHDFIAEVSAKGAAAAMVCHERTGELPETGIPLIRVENTRLGLGQLAAFWRGRFDIPVVAVTGSNGKTTVKEMTAGIMRHAAGAAGHAGRADEVLATEGNLNNDIGMPLTLLRMRERHRYAVIEMGMNHAGEISYLTRLARPDVAVITNAGAAHVEGLVSIEAVARAKGEIFEGLGPGGTAVINADDPYAPLWRKLAGNRKIVEFGLDDAPDVSARYQLDFFSARITLVTPDGTRDVVLQVPGEHNVRNALAAAAASAALGAGLDAIASGLSEFNGIKGRMQKKSGLHGAILIDDTYNANPASVSAALSVLAKAGGRKILILGDMGELGRDARVFHERIGEEARVAGIDQLFALGELSAYAAAGFGAGARHFESMEKLLPEVQGLLAADVTLLIKGSRFMKMEQVVKSVEA
ncbi:MAG TPA: UDP-N-acetylmuramoyl-tripeptide--D-alanyl-D-alanine ligase [Nitrosospira sp.]